MAKNAPRLTPGILLSDFAKMSQDERLAMLGITQETVNSVVRDTATNYLNSVKHTAEKEAHQNAVAVR